EAQGCEVRATLGHRPTIVPNRNAVAANPWRANLWLGGRNPFGIVGGASEIRFRHAIESHSRWRTAPRLGILKACHNLFPPFTFISSSPPKTPSVPARQTCARRAPLLSRRRLQTTRLPAHPRRRRGRPHPSARAIRTHHHAGRMGEGIETRLEHLAGGTRS